MSHVPEEKAATRRRRTAPVAAALTASVIAVAPSLAIASPGPHRIDAPRTVAHSTAQPSDRTQLAADSATARSPRYVDPIPKDQIAAKCGLDPQLLTLADAASPGLAYSVFRHGYFCWRSITPGTDAAGNDDLNEVFSTTKPRSVDG